MSDMGRLFSPSFQFLKVLAPYKLLVAGFHRAFPSATLDR